MSLVTQQKDMKNEVKSEIKISKRLEHVIAMIPQGRTVCDVGCDHGYVPIALVQRGISEYVLAMDVGEGPLASARENISKCYLEDHIETRLSDGLAEYRKAEAQILILAGMGGPLMLQILAAYPEKTMSFEGMVLQPQSKLDEFRRELVKLGLSIRAEDMVEEDGKFYPMMYVSPSDSSKEETALSFGEAEFIYGPFLLRHKHPVLLRFLEKEEKTLRLIRKQMDVGGADEREHAEIELRLAANLEAQRIMKQESAN